MLQFELDKVMLDDGVVSKKKMSLFVIPAKGLVAKHYCGVFEIATAYFIGLAMTLKRSVCHCEE